MRSRLLRMSLLATIITTPAFAAVSDDLASLALLPSKEKSLITTFTNAYPALSVPKVGDSSKDVFVSTEKLTVKNEAGAKIGTSTCVVTITHSHKIVKVDYPNYFVHTTQALKMLPLDCAADEFNGLAFGADSTSRISKVSVPIATDFSDLLGKWDSWTLSGKNVKYSASGVEEEEGYTYTQSGTINLGASNVLCIGATDTWIEKSSEDSMDDDGNPITIDADYKEVTTSTCQTAKPVYGKAGADIINTTIDEGTEYCIEDEANYFGRVCSLDQMALGEVAEFPEQIIDGLPLLDVLVEPVR